MFSFFATRLNGDGTEQRIATDIEFDAPPLTFNLSGVNSMTASVSPEIARLKGSDGKPLFLPWSTALYAESDNRIRFGGIVTDLSMQDEVLSLTVEGFVAYAAGQPYEGEIVYRNADPIRVAKDIWSHLQDKEGANLDLQVLGGNSPVRIGMPPDNPEDDDEGYPLNWWSTHDIGRVFDDLAVEAPFDYVEDHYFDGEEIKHRLRLFYPERNSRRTDLRFAVNENVFVVPTVEQHGDDYASHVVVLGAGEGREMVRGEAAAKPKRLRRVSVVADKTIQSRQSAVSLAQLEADLMQGAESINTLVVADHPHAPFMTYGVGDAIRITGFSGWAGDIDMWVRITAATINTDNRETTLAVERA